MTLIRCPWSIFCSRGAPLRQNRNFSQSADVVRVEVLCAGETSYLGPMEYPIAKYSQNSLKSSAWIMLL